MALESPAVDHAIVHGTAHGARVCIVDDDTVGQAVQNFQLLFPHEHVLRLRVGSHCLHLHSAASLADIAAVTEQHRQLERLAQEGRPSCCSTCARR